MKVLRADTFLSLGLGLAWWGRLLYWFNHNLTGVDLLVALGHHELKEVDISDVGVELILELEIIWVHLVLQHGHVEAETLLLHE